MMEARRLGRSNILVSPLGLGTARMAGLGWREDSVEQLSAQAMQEGVQQIQAAVELGVTFFDTADSYGQGLSERILGEALRSRSEGIVVATKFGENPLTEQDDAWRLDADSTRRACEASLGRLGFECIDLYLLHRRDYPLERAPEMMEALEELVRAGKIRYYGWSTDDVERARLFARGEHCIAIEHRLNVFNDNSAMLDLCQEHDLASLNRVPLLMGVLTGRWSAETQLGEEDPRGRWFQDEGFLKLLDCAHEITPYLTQGGRSYVQGALGWIWARSAMTIPLPGFRNLEQVIELAQAQQYGPLPGGAMEAIAECVKRAGLD
jgi:aryl-alcohol dehydrogenase-like predicted oxidoreductase